MITLSDKAIDAIRKDTALKGKLQSVLNISGNTLYAWLKKNDPKLTNVAAIETIIDSTGIEYDQVIQRTA